MPREDVPYPGGALCRLKCQINELWQAVRNKLHSINGVPGDGNGDVKILAGQNVQIVNDQVHNEITISAAAPADIVKSVNGDLPDQDGDVTVDTGVMTVNGDLPDATGDVTVDTGVMTINSVTPDADGEITITAGSNITITPDAVNNSIEIAAAGGGSTEEWTLVTTANWSSYLNGRVALRDMLLTIKGTYIYDDCLVPKGTDVYTIGCNSITGSTGHIYYVPMTFHYGLLFTNTGSPFGMPYIDYQIGGSGTSQTEYLNKITDPSSISDGIRLYIKV